MSGIFPTNLDFFSNPGADPMQDMAALQLAAGLLKPIQPGTQTSMGNFGEALIGSVEYLRKLRQEEAKGKLAERQVTAAEKGVTLKGEEVDIARGGLEIKKRETAIKEGDAPHERDLTDAKTDYYRANTKLERQLLRMQAKMGAGFKYDKDIWEIAKDLAGEPDPGKPGVWEKRVHQYYNNMAKRYNLPEVPPLPPNLEDIPDESLLKMNPQQESVFMKWYGEDGRLRLEAARGALNKAGGGISGQEGVKDSLDFLRPQKPTELSPAQGGSGYDKYKETLEFAKTINKSGIITLKGAPDNRQAKDFVPKIRELRQALSQTKNRNDRAILQRALDLLVSEERKRMKTEE